MMPRRSLHDGAHLVGVRGKNDDVWRCLVMPRLTVTVMLELCRIRRAAIADDGAQFRDERRRARMPREPRTSGRLYYL